MAIRVEWERPPGGGIGCMIRMGEVSIGATSDDAVSALHAASGLAHDMSKAMASHPELQALMPPQVVLALKAVRIASWAAKHGKLPEAAATIGPQAVSTVKRLLKGIL